MLDAPGFNKREMHLVCGPTTKGQPIFTWSGFCPAAAVGKVSSGSGVAGGGGGCNISHIGLVDSFDFAWQRYKIK